MDILHLAQPIRGGIYIAAFVVCILFLTIIRKTTPRNKTFLIAFLGLKILVALCEWLLIHVAYPSAYFWLSILIVLSFGSAPMLLRFALGITDQVFSTRFKPWEWGIVITSIAFMMPLFLASQVCFSFEVSPEFGRFIHISMSLCIVLFVIQVSLYWRKAYVIYKYELLRTMANFSTLKQHSLTILKLLLILVLANVVFGLLRTFNVWFWHTQLEITLLANILEYTILLGCLFLMVHNTFTVTPVPTSEPTENRSHKRPKYAKTPLDDAFRNKIAAKLHDTAKITKLALDSTTSLAKLSEAIGEKPYYVTQVLNQNLETNFYDFITEHRIQKVIQQLSEASHLSILDIALASGFNSKSTFNTAFKKRTGLTPSQFRAQKLGQSPSPLS